MEKEQREEFGRLRDEAIRILRGGSNQPHFTRELHVLVLPSFQDCRSYEYFRPQPRTSHLAVAVTTVWKREVDLAKFVDPIVRLRQGVGNRISPTFEQTATTTLSKELDRLLDVAKAVRVPPRVDDPALGVDGTSYELSMGGLVSSQFRWWNTAPGGWQPLKEVVDEIEALMLHHTQR